MMPGMVLAKKVVEKPKEKKAGILIIPDNQGKKQELYEVVKFDWDLDFLDFGTIIVIKPYGWQEIRVNDEDYVVIKSEDIVMILKEPKDED